MHKNCIPFGLSLACPELVEGSKPIHQRRSFTHARRQAQGEQLYRN